MLIVAFTFVLCTSIILGAYSVFVVYPEDKAARKLRRRLANVPVQRTDRRADLTEDLETAEHERTHGDRENDAGRGDHRAGPGHRPDDAGIQACMNLFLESRNQQQVVVGPHRQQQDHGQRQHDPVELDAEDVLPHQH